jgi:hypothetical protein
MVLSLSNSNNPDTHPCETHRDGDWIVFTCPKCADFERRLNYVTGEFVCQPDENPYVQHEGNYHPVGFEVNVSTAN